MRFIAREKAAREGANTVIAAVVVVILLLSAAGALYVLAGSSPAVVKAGDKIAVDYVGRLPDGRVFDTSLWSVATDDGNHSKSLLFTLRGNQTKYAPLEFTVGKGMMIKGFDQGVIGMKVGETRDIVVPPEKGYGSVDPSKTIQMNMTSVVPVYAEMSLTEFRARYSYTGTPHSLELVTDPIYGWTVKVLDSSDGMVSLMNDPKPGSTYRYFGSPGDSSYGWNITVTDHNVSKGESGEITIQHKIDSGSAYHVKGYDSVGLAAGKYHLNRCIVISVDEAAGKFTLNYDQPMSQPPAYPAELVGQTLTFTVTVVRIG